jgi:carboxypeptidase Q
MPTLTGCSSFTARRRASARVLFLVGLTSMVIGVAPSAQAPRSRPAASPGWIDPYREPAARLLGESLSTSFAWERLALLGDTFGHRLSGSQALEDAIQWAVQEMKKDGLENVHAEPVKVPHWVRGQESVEITAPRRLPMVMLGLGNSVGTPADGVQAEVLVVKSFDELEAKSAQAKGKIVF